MSLFSFLGQLWLFNKIFGGGSRDNHFGHDSFSNTHGNCNHNDYYPHDDTFSHRPTYNRSGLNLPDDEIYDGYANPIDNDLDDDYFDDF